MSADPAERTGSWIDCVTCNNVLLADECVVCGDEYDPEQYGLTDKGFNHWCGPFCSAKCRERVDGYQP